MLERMEGRVSPSCLAALYLPLVWLYEQQGRYHDGRGAAERAVELAEAAQDRVLVARAYVLLGGGLRFIDQEAARQVLATAVSLAEDAGHLDTLFWALVGLAQVWGEPHGERRYAARSLEIAERVDDPLQMVGGEFLLAGSSFVVGEWQQSRVHATRVAAILCTLGPSLFLGASEVLLANLDVAEGNWEAAVTSLEEIITAENFGFPEALWQALQIRAELDLLQGQPADALAHLQPLLADVGCAEAQWTMYIATLAEAYLGVGDSERARAVLDEGLARARATQNRWDVMTLRRVEGMLLARDGRWEEAGEVFREAVSLARRGSVPYEEARALYEWGRMNREAGAGQQAREHLEEALALFGWLGARPSSERTERLLADLG